MHKITIKDIAKMLNISVSTVSRALSDHPDISKETKVRVKEVAQQFNYLPNLHARFFRKKNTKLIALIIPEFNRFFIPDLIAGIQKVIDDNEYSLIIFQSRNNFAIEAEVVKYCLSWVVEGVLISLSDETKNTEHLKILRDNDIPTVILDKVLKTAEYSTVKINDHSAAHLATKAIVAKNRKKILGVFGNENTFMTAERMRGFKDALISEGIAVSDQNICIVNDIHQINDILDRSKDKMKNIDGIFFMTDELMVYSLNYFYKIGYKAGQDLSIISISDGSAPYFLYPNISHIFHSGFTVGETACKLLFELLREDDKSKTISKTVETKLVDLGSI
jgi:LacI family transcriptional regulator